MLIMDAIRYWKYRYDRAKDYSDPHWEGSERREHREYVDAIAEAIEALEKQRLKEPIERSFFYFCPVCGNQVVITDFETDITMDYCMKCGQALKWEEE